MTAILPLPSVHTIEKRDELSYQQYEAEQDVKTPCTKNGSLFLRNTSSTVGPLVTIFQKQVSSSKKKKKIHMVSWIIKKN